PASVLLMGQLHRPRASLSLKRKCAGRGFLSRKAPPSRAGVRLRTRPDLDRAAALTAGGRFRRRRITPGRAPGLPFSASLAARCGSTLAVRYWWGACEGAVWRWRKALGVERSNEGAARLHRLKPRPSPEALIGIGGVRAQDDHVRP